ncbi:rCG24551 [Rattus norvegicus]|uniref:RCG24551 n=1 Tax=Rattus norvegicus TaxID=10116 RepID=A6JC40_RAT|nr:rCG24551 [Rattus norvegicus]
MATPPDSATPWAKHIQTITEMITNIKGKLIHEK